MRLGFTHVVPFLVLLATAVAGAADVSIDISTRRTYVGAPVTLEITISDARSYEAPPVPEIPGAIVQRMPGERSSSLTQIINGRVTKTVSTVVTYRITPRQPGTITVPALTVQADGKKFTSDPIKIEVVKAETGDLLQVEVAAGRPAIYLGEPLDLELRIWIKPYRDQRYEMTLSERDMWGLIREGASSLGLFGERLQELAERRRRPIGRQILSEDGDGQPALYYLYEVTTTIWPEQAGPVDLGTIAVGLQYPVRLARGRSLLFRDELQLAEARPVQAVAEVPVIEVRQPPKEGRPSWFTGAVGQFDMEVAAQPTDVAVGDPITITITITDRSGAPGRLDLLAPPPLLRVEELTERFRVPTDPLAGVVEGRVKRFTQTLRAVNDQVAAIPAIPFAFFDPIQEKYVTRRSRPIDLTVRPASELPLTSVIGADDAPSLGATALTETAGGLLANELDSQLVLSSTGLAWRPWTVAVLLLPPLLFVGTVVAQWQTGRRRREEGRVRHRRAARHARRRIDQARAAGASEQAGLIGAALASYVVERCRLPAGVMTRPEVLQALRQRLVSPAVLNDVETLLAECEQHRYAGVTGATSDDLASRAERLIRRLDRERLR